MHSSSTSLVLKAFIAGALALGAAAPSMAAPVSTPVPGPDRGLDHVAGLLEAARNTEAQQPDLAVLARRVAKELAWGLGERLEHSVVSVEDDRVVVRGQVATGEDRDEARRRVRAVTDGRHVSLELSAADGSTSTDADAAVLVSAPEDSLSALSFVTEDGRAARDLLILDEGGVLTLIGAVNSPRARELCVAAARAMPGTRAVRDRLAVRKPSAVEDRNIEEIVRFRLSEYADLAPYLEQGRRPARERDRTDPVDVSVHDGVVRLTGTVRSPAHKALAVSLTDNLAGTFLVDDRLAVDPGLPEPIDPGPRAQTRFHGLSGR